jgi:hypothetical protein
MKKLFLISAVILLIISCTNSKKTVYKEDESQIFFGNSGGFTNAKMEYVINGDRNLYKIDKDTTIFVKKISRDQFKELNKIITDIDFGKLVLNNPGNMTHFIHVKCSEYDNKVNWSGEENESVTDLYKFLLSTLKSE